MMNQQHKHEPTLSPRELLQATISILEGELGDLQGDEARQEQLDRLVGELGYAKQQLEKRLIDPGVRCTCGTRMELAGAMGWRCGACGQYEAYGSETAGAQPKIARGARRDAKA